ncbi:conserved hypothetical protein [Alteromonas sp. 38]|uniref:DUF2897 family protein n=1 Tax=Alteromonas TaxID=226 RepID=UPI0012F1B000|nr:MULTISPECIES: DUF2897 family protein [Alteromonas]CAD5281069.1 conserved hypothetical protein [Alteromonas sp. 154]VXB83071.1 conserved hypothetical protein [Alteromonas sp. 38]
MDTLWVVIIIVIVLGVVIGNITLLKYSAKFKFPTPLKKNDDKQKKNGFEDEEDDW